MVPLGLPSARPMAQALRLPFEYYCTQYNIRSFTSSSQIYHFLSSASMDYTPANGEFTFSPSASLWQCVNITIEDDSVSEPVETFSVSISTSVGRVVLEPNITVVEIVDDDGERERERGREGGREGGREWERERGRERGRGGGGRREARRDEDHSFSYLYDSRPRYHAIQYVQLSLF